MSYPSPISNSLNARTPLSQQLTANSPLFKTFSPPQQDEEEEGRKMDFQPLTEDIIKKGFRPQEQKRGWECHVGNRLFQVKQEGFMNLLHIKSKCWSSNFDQEYEQDVIVNLSMRRIDRAACTCPQKTSCKHCAAVLYEAIHLKRTGKTNDPLEKLGQLSTQLKEEQRKFLVSEQKNQSLQHQLNMSKIREQEAENKQQEAENQLKTVKEQLIASTQLTEQLQLQIKELQSKPQQQQVVQPSNQGARQQFQPVKSPHIDEESSLEEEEVSKLQMPTGRSMGGLIQELVALDHRPSVNQPTPNVSALTSKSVLQSPLVKDSSAPQHNQASLSSKSHQPITRAFRRPRSVTLRSPQRKKLKRKRTHRSSTSRSRRLSINKTKRRKTS